MGVTGPRHLVDFARTGSNVPPGQVERATSRLLEVLRPAA
jgi:hypothetical protein